MNNLVKFLILNFLILWSASLNADSKPLPTIKCDLERNGGQLDTRKRELIVELDVANKYYYALLWVDGSKHIGHIWRHEDSLALLGDNDEFYVFEDLNLWKYAYSEETLIERFELIPLRVDNRLNDAFVSKYFSVTHLQKNTSIKSGVRLNRETLILTDPDTRPKEHKCRLIDEKAAEAEYEELGVLFEDNWTEALKRNEELEAKKEEQKERFKL